MVSQAPSPSPVVSSVPTTHAENLVVAAPVPLLSTPPAADYSGYLEVDVSSFPANTYVLAVRKRKSVRRFGLWKAEPPPPPFLGRRAARGGGSNSFVSCSSELLLVVVKPRRTGAVGRPKETKRSAGCPMNWLAFSFFYNGCIGPDHYIENTTDILC